MCMTAKPVTAVTRTGEAMIRSYKTILPIALLSCLFCLSITSQALAQEKILTTQVTHLAGSNIYLGSGSNDGIQQGDTLFVAVESASWRMELSMMRPQLMRKLNAGKRQGRIERIVFVQADGRVSEERDGQG